MKIRNGFVSNSSAASFCIYGWTEFNFKADTNMYDFYRYLRDYIPEITESSSEYGGLVVGVGNTASDFDHDCNEDEDWKDYKCDPPNKEQMEKLDKIAEWLGLPAPTIHAETWYNG